MWPVIMLRATGFLPPSGKLIHMHCDELPELQKHILQHHGFAIDPVRTIFYGVCSDCAKEKQ